MQRLLAALFAVGAAVVAVADTQVVCSITPQAQTACSALTVSQAAQLDPCRCNPTPTPTPEPSVYDDAIALWKLDEASGTRADSIGSLDLTDNNTVGSTSKGVGAPANLPGTVASFVAANSEYLSLSSGIAELDDQFTLAGWVYQGAYVAEAGVFNNGPNTDFGVRVTMNVVGNGDILVRLPTDATNSANIYGYTASGLVPTGQWVHVVITYDGTDATAANRLHVYTDGVDRSLTRNGTNPSAVRVGGSFAIGQGGATNFVTGRYSVFAVWDYTKDADGVAALYNSGDGAVLP